MCSFTNIQLFFSSFYEMLLKDDREIVERHTSQSEKKNTPTEVVGNLKITGAQFNVTSVC